MYHFKTPDELNLLELVVLINVATRGIKCQKTVPPGP